MTDVETGEPLPFVNVVLFLNGNQVTGGTTDFDGEYTIKPINPGSYDALFSFVGYTPKRVTGVKVTANKIQFVNATLGAGVMMDEAEVIEYTVPLIDRDGGASGGTVTREDIEKLPGRDALAVATTVAGVGTTGTGGGVSIRGARTSSTWYYIDGVKVRGSSALPKSAIEEVSVITGGIPANIGDVTGGVISISLRNSSSKWFGGAEVISSGLPLGDDQSVGLDKYGYNLAEATISGPIAFAKNEDGSRGRPLARPLPHRQLHLQLRWAADVWWPEPHEGERCAPAAHCQIPLRQNIDLSTGDINGALYNADFLTPDAFEAAPTRLNAANTSAQLVAKIDVNTSETVSLTFGGTGLFNRGHNFSYANSLMNWENNSLSTNLNWRAYAKFAQRFQAEEGEDEGGLSNVFYQIMVDFTQNTGRTEDDTHGDDLMKYGHLGRFNVYQQNSYQYDAGADVFRHVGWEDTAVYFNPSAFNPELAAITQQYFNLFDRHPYSPFLDGPYDNLLTVQNNALLNGQGAPSTYGLWNYYGSQSNGFSQV